MVWAGAFFQNLLKGKTGDLPGQAVRYIVAGTAAFAVDFMLLKIFTDYLGIPPVASAAIGFSAGLVITYLLSIRWVFSRRKLADRRREFAVFAAIGLVGLGLTSLFMWIFTAFAGIHYLVSKLLITVIVTAWNFTAKKIALF